MNKNMIKVNKNLTIFSQNILNILLYSTTYLTIVFDRV